LVPLIVVKTLKCAIIPDLGVLNTISVYQIYHIYQILAYLTGPVTIYRIIDIALIPANMTFNFSTQCILLLSMVLPKKYTKQIYQLCWWQIHGHFMQKVLQQFYKVQPTCVNFS